MECRSAHMSEVDYCLYSFGLCFRLPISFSERKRQQSRVGASHRIGKNDSLKWFQQKVS